MGSREGFSGNGGGGIYVRESNAESALLSLRNSIVANSTSPAPDCVLDGSVATTDSTTDLIELNTGCAGVNATGDPLLGPLADNGGLTPTLLPAIGSPAVNAASATACTNTDQRGVQRPVGSACDEGSVEANPKAGRSVKIKYKAGKEAFTGKLKADLAQCVTGKVKVLRSQQGDDEKVAKGKVKSSGKYVAKQPDPPSGKYYALAKQTQANEITCLQAKSKKTRIG